MRKIKNENYSCKMMTEVSLQWQRRLLNLFFWLTAERKFARKSQWGQIFSPGKLILCPPPTLTSLKYWRRDARTITGEQKNNGDHDFFVVTKQGQHRCPQTEKQQSETNTTERDTIKAREEFTEDYSWWALYSNEWEHQALYNDVKSIILQWSGIRTPATARLRMCHMSTRGLRECARVDAQSVPLWCVWVPLDALEETAVHLSEWGLTSLPNDNWQYSLHAVSYHRLGRYVHPATLLQGTCPFSWAPFGIQDCCERAINFE